MDYNNVLFCTRNLESRDWNAASLLVRGPFCFLYNISLLVVISFRIFFIFLAILLIIDCYAEKNEIQNSLSSLSSATFLVRETWTVCHQLNRCVDFVSIESLNVSWWVHVYMRIANKKKKRTHGKISSECPLWMRSIVSRSRRGVPALPVVRAWCYRLTCGYMSAQRNEK